MDDGPRISVDVSWTPIGTAPWRPRAAVVKGTSRFTGQGSSSVPRTTHVRFDAPMGRVRSEFVQSRYENVSFFALPGCTSHDRSDYSIQIVVG